MQQSTPFDSILVQSRDLMCERLADAVTGMLNQADDALSALIAKTQDAEAQKLYTLTRDVALQKREAIESEFQDRYLQEYQQRCSKAKKTSQNPFSANDADEAGDAEKFSFEMELVGDDDLNETLKFNEMAARLRRYCEEELGALDQRVGVLLGDANLQADDNPFSPQAICNAYKQTCRQVDSNVHVRIVLVKLFDDHVLDDIRSIYKDVNELLVENSILPKIRYGVSRKEGVKTPSRAGHADEEVREAAVQQAEGAIASGQDVFAALQKLFASNVGAFLPQGGAGGGIAGEGGAPMVLQGAELLGSLTRIQLGDVSAVTGGTLPAMATAGDAGPTNVLRELKGTNVGAGMGQMDAMTLDIVSLLFDQLFDEPKIPAGVKGLIGRMQIPMLKVAIADKSFFSQKDHPARMLLDTLGEIALRLPADFNASSPQFARLETILNELMEGFQDNLEIFTTTGERLRALVAEDNQRVAHESQAAAKMVEQRENLAVARSAAQEEIKTRLVTRKPARPVLEFLIQQWIKFLLIVHAQSGKESDAWKGALETMDQLIWSVEPKNQIGEHRKLATMVPGLLKRLTGGLAAAGIEDTVRTRFFADLMKLHTRALGMDGKGKADATAETGASHAPNAPIAPVAPHAAPAGTIAPAPTTAPASTMAKARANAMQSGAATPNKPTPPSRVVADDSDSLDFTAEITVKNPFGGGDVQVEELDFTEPAAALAPSDAASGPAAASAAPTGAGATKASAKDVELPRRLKEGVWVGIRAKNPEEPRETAKLEYVSPLKTRYLFVDRQGKTVLECTRTDLSRRFRLRDLVILNEVPETSLFDRIMQGVVGKLGNA